MKTLSPRQGFRILPFVAVALLGLALPAALSAQEAVAAQQPAAPPAAEPLVVREISAEKLAQYAAASAEIADVRERINAEFARTGNKIHEAQTELRKERQEEVKRIIQEKGLTIEEFEQITWVLSVDAKQMEAFAALVAQQREGGVQQ